MTVVTDRRTALQALETIVDQGEGSVGVPDSHYAIFVQLYQMRKEWTCIPFIDEPRTEKYKANTVAYHVRRLCSLLYARGLTTNGQTALARGERVLLLPAADDRPVLAGKHEQRHAQAGAAQHPPHHGRHPLAECTHARRPGDQ